ncbi:hypothetical protein ASF06_09200 [Agreia sp. Leaf244]|nr:hypothetical protein ASF06_09200 [Agreia sp. Leaf244]
MTWVIFLERVDKTPLHSFGRVHVSRSTISAAIPTSISFQPIRGVLQGVQTYSRQLRGFVLIEEDLLSIVLRVAS